MVASVSFDDQVIGAKATHATLAAFATADRESVPPKSVIGAQAVRLTIKSNIGSHSRVMRLVNRISCLR